MNSALRVGLTGGIGSGKSTVAQMLVDLGAHLVDTDAISRQLTSPGGLALPAIRDAFGGGVFDAIGQLDRSALRGLVFNNSGLRHRLEAVLHPLIAVQVEQQTQTGLDNGASTIVFDVPLLAESTRWRGRVDRVLVVDCSLDTQAERVAARPGWTRQAALQVIATQASRELRRSIADAVLFNDGLSIDALRSSVQAMWRVWQRGS